MLDKFRLLQKMRGKINARLNEMTSRLHMIKYNTLGNIIKDCVDNLEHRKLLYMLLQSETPLILDFRHECAKMVDAYLKFVRPVALERLIRVGGNTDGGYV
ncbi:hypothetical protein, partial [Helicobacter vulpis]|uniref:hypothetical protein n=1 Tax=Helicobacter vulpis TaxID=2316076 RepID=UPI0013CE1A43